MGELGAFFVLAEFAVAGIAAWLIVGEINTNLYVPFLSGRSIPLGPLYYVFAATVIVGMGNAVNLTDGLDGLATMPVVIAAGAFAIICYVVGRVDYSDYLGIPYVPLAGELALFDQREERVEVQAVGIGATVDLIRSAAANEGALHPACRGRDSVRAGSEAIVDPGAELAATVSVGPYAVIGAGVQVVQVPAYWPPRHW